MGEKMCIRFSIDGAMSFTQIEKVDDETYRLPTEADEEYVSAALGNIYESGALGLMCSKDSCSYEIALKVYIDGVGYTMSDFRNMPLEVFFGLLSQSKNCRERTAQKGDE